MSYIKNIILSARQWGEKGDCVCEEDLRGYLIPPHRKRWEEMLNIEKRSWADLPFQWARLAQLEMWLTTYTCLCVSVCVLFALWYYSDVFQAFFKDEHLSVATVSLYFLQVHTHAPTCAHTQTHSITKVVIDFTRTLPYSHKASQEYSDNAFYPSCASIKSREISQVFNVPEISYFLARSQCASFKQPLTMFI